MHDLFDMPLSLATSQGDQHMQLVLRDDEAV